MLRPLNYDYAVYNKIKKKTMQAFWTSIECLKWAKSWVGIMSISKLFKHSYSCKIKLLWGSSSRPDNFTVSFSFTYWTLLIRCFQSKNNYFGLPICRQRLMWNCHEKNRFLFTSRNVMCALQMCTKTSSQMWTSHLTGGCWSLLEISQELAGVCWSLLDVLEQALGCHGRQTS